MPPPFPPIVPATFSAKPTIGSAPLTVQFTSGAQWGTNSLLSFGDGSNATNVNPSHVYSSDGVFTVTLYNVLPATNQAVVIYYNYITVTN
jgi:PKD repeat protein